LSEYLFGSDWWTLPEAAFNRPRRDLMWVNFGRIHKTLRVTSAMEAGKTDHVWSLEEIAELAA